MEQQDTDPIWIAELDSQPVKLRRDTYADGETIICHLTGPAVTSPPLLIASQNVISVLPHGVEDQTTKIRIIFLDHPTSTPKISGNHDNRSSIDPQQEARDVMPKLRTLDVSQEFLRKFGSTTRFADVDRNSRPTAAWLSSDLNIHVIISPTSGKGQAEAFFDQILSPTLEHHRRQRPGTQVQKHITSSSQAIEDLGREVIAPAALDNTAQLVILLTGDGGIMEFINGFLPAVGDDQERASLPYAKPTIALIPMGTANALAHSSGISDGTYGLHTLFHGNPKRLPLFFVSFDEDAKFLVDEGRREVPVPKYRDDWDLPSMFGAVVASWGLHAALVADSDTAEYRKHGSSRFAMAAQELLFPKNTNGPHVFKGTIQILKEIDGKQSWHFVDGNEFLYVLGTMVSHLEETFCVSPFSKPLDESLRLIHFGPMTGKQCVEILQKAYDKGKHVEDERVAYEELCGFKVTANEEDVRWRRVCIDGRIILLGQGSSFNVKKDKEHIQAFNILAVN